MTKLLNGTKYFLLAGLMAFALVSCDKDKDEDSAATEAELIGTWNITSSETDFTVNGVPIMDFIMEAFSISEEQAELMLTQMLEEYGEDLEITGTVEFKDDNTYVMVTDGVTDTGTWELQSGGKEIIMDKGTEDETVITVKKSTSSEIVIEFTPPNDEDDEPYDLDRDGEPDTMDIILGLTLTKE